VTAFDSYDGHVSLADLLNYVGHGRFVHFARVIEDDAFLAVVDDDRKEDVRISKILL
jgi:hypothetical protein